ncbi:MAG TPA: NAD(P)/FAD-dependent oxidoreductase [Thermoanaerobaculia bacterium]|jgi:flavin-dependent dehydrogenase
MADVVIIGAGPAGSACALTLRAHAPSLSVALYEASRFETPRLGETLPPAARTLLDQLGVFDAFRAAGHREVYGTASSWGSARPIDNDFVFFAHGPGWHLDRAAFDRMLAEEAEKRGVTLVTGTPVSLPENARFVVDATGSASIATRTFGARFVTIDHLVSFVRFYESAGESDPRTMVEAFSDGWWYTAALPNGGRVIACMTDADIARRMSLSDEASWQAALDAMPLIAAMARKATGAGGIVARSTESRRLEPPCGEGWLAAGDAASRFDPLSSQGITKALRSGIFAAYAIGDLLTDHTDRGLRGYERFIRAEFEAYRVSRAAHYADEQRWPDREFWMRRGGAMETRLPT